MYAGFVVVVAVIFVIVVLLSLNIPFTQLNPKVRTELQVGWMGGSGGCCGPITN